MTLACVRGCTRLRRHATDCDDRDNCQGCEPRLADYGQLCWPCHRRLELMLTDAPGVWYWLTGNLGRMAGSAGVRQDYERPSRSTGSPAPISEAVYDVRQQLEDRLAGWVDNLVADHRLSGPDRHLPEADAAYLLTWLDRIEAGPWVADMFEELADTMIDAHALAPWRPVMRRCYGVACPECEECALVIFGGDSDVTCTRCRAIIPSDRFGLWVQILAEQVVRVPA